MKYADIHTHNRNAGPDAIINLDLGELIPAEGAYSVGIHPWTTENITEADMQRLADMAQDPRIVAIGECGLDARHGAPLPRQEEIFLVQAKLSEELKKPLIIHAVHTHQRIIELRRMLKPSQQWIIHGFRGKPQLAQALLKCGCDISIGEKYNPQILDVVPADRLYHETDDACL